MCCGVRVPKSSHIIGVPVCVCGGGQPGVQSEFLVRQGSGESLPHKGGGGETDTGRSEQLAVQLSRYSAQPACLRPGLPSSSSGNREELNQASHPSTQEGEAGGSSVKSFLV